MHYVYIIYSASHDVYYKGYTTRPKLRLQQHNNDEGRKTGASNNPKALFIPSFGKAKFQLSEREITKVININ